MDSTDKLEKLRAYQREWARKRIQMRRASGLCIDCGNPPGNGHVRCDYCLRMQRERTARYRERHPGKGRERYWRERNRGTCKTCGKTVLPGHTLCLPCLDKASSAMRDRRDRLKADGRCSCGGLALPHLLHLKRPLCERCLLGRMARENLGSWKRHPEIKALFERQSGRCAYTGEVLVLGVNASLDHIFPKCRFPELAHEITNLEWVTREVNSMKARLTKDEFLERLRLRPSW